MLIRWRFAAANLDREADVPGFNEVVDALAQDDKQRIDFFKACLRKLGLQVNEEQNTVPSLSRLHLSSVQPEATSELLSALDDIIDNEDGHRIIKDENDTFRIEQASAWSWDDVANTLPRGEDSNADAKAAPEDRILDYSTITKQIVVHDKELPQTRATPYFNHQAYFSNLKHYQSTTRRVRDDFGKSLLYGEVVTSTNTLLEKYESMALS